MTDPVPKWHSAWEPFTPRGVAAFAGGSFGRLFLAQLIMAGLAAVSLAFFLQHAWFPVVTAAIESLPADEVKISHANLNWTGDSPAQLAQNHFLSLAIDLDHSGTLGRESHLQVEFGRDDLRLYSQFGLGYLEYDYVPGREMPFNRAELKPWWGAWKPFILVGTMLGTIAALMITWTVMATIYFLPVWIISFVENRDLNLRQSWRLAGAALMPGTLFMALGIFAYAMGVFDLLKLGTALGLHFIIVWLYLLISPLFCPRHAAKEPTSANPFSTAKEKPANANPNPFAAPPPTNPPPDTKIAAPENKKPSL